MNRRSLLPVGGGAAAGVSPPDLAAGGRGSVLAGTDGGATHGAATGGSAADGTPWVQQPADLSGAAGLSAFVFGPIESANTLSQVAVYAGPDREVTGGFDTTRAVEDHAGWQPSEYPVDYDGTGIVAVGVSVVRETYVRRLVDDVRLFRAASVPPNGVILEDSTIREFESTCRRP